MDESKLKNSVILRMVFIGVLSVLLMLPALFVEALISERQLRSNAALAEISQSWGGTQTLTGPILTIPFKKISSDEKGNTAFSLHHAHFLPSRLAIEGQLRPEIRYRGIYEAALYEGRLTLEGEFNRPDMRPFVADPENVLWRNAFVTLGVTDLKGVHDTVRLAWNGESYTSTPGVRSGELASSGMTFTPPLASGSSAVKFSLALTLGGSTDLLFVPVGETTSVVLESPWGDPSFIGGFLPVSREIADDHFKAEWKILSLNRNFPQSWTGEPYQLSESSFGTRLFLPVDQYQKTSRTVKYAFLFIVLTFASLFLSEMMTRTILHPIQYSLIGFALVLFYLMLLSFSEHMRFDGAFAVSSISTIGLVSLYTSWIAAKRIAAVTAIVLTALYIFLYITLQLQDYALLVGTLGLTATLAVIMYVTRRVDWFALNTLARDH